MNVKTLMLLSTYDGPENNKAINVAKFTDKATGRTVITNNSRAPLSMLNGSKLVKASAETTEVSAKTIKKDFRVVANCDKCKSFLHMPNEQIRAYAKKNDPTVSIHCNICGEEADIDMASVIEEMSEENATRGPNKNGSITAMDDADMNNSDDDDEDDDDEDDDSTNEDDTEDNDLNVTSGDNEDDDSTSVDENTNAADENVADEDDEDSEDVENPLITEKKDTPDVKEDVVAEKKAAKNNINNNNVVPLSKPMDVAAHEAFGDLIASAVFDLVTIDAENALLLASYDSVGQQIPVARLTASKADASIKPLFATEEKLSAAFATVFAEKPLTMDSAELKAFGYSPIIFNVKTDEAIKRRIDTGILAMTAELQELRANTLTDVMQCIGIEALRSTKRLEASVNNPVREALLASLNRVGVRDASALIDTAFANHGAEWLKTIVANSQNLMNKPLVARNEIATIIEASTPRIGNVKSDADEVADHLANNSLPISVPAKPNPTVSEVTASHKEGTHNPTVKKLLANLGASRKIA